MPRFLIVLSLMALQQCSAEVPKLLQQEQFSAADLAEAVNHFVGVGEAEAVNELNALASTETNGDNRRITYRIGCVCRILFLPKIKQPLLPPRFGALEDLGSFGMDSSIGDIIKVWPLYPVVLAGRSYFVLGEHYALGGRGENPKAYISYCQANGVFRTKSVMVPTRARAIKDAAAFRRSKAWKAVKWEGYGSEEESWKFIQNQAESIPSS
jgi:hypothetical protein